jgi:hypothetical protein
VTSSLARGTVAELVSPQVMALVEDLSKRVAFLDAVSTDIVDVCSRPIGFTADLEKSE